MLNLHLFSCPIILQIHWWCMIGIWCEHSLRCTKNDRKSHTRKCHSAGHRRPLLSNSHQRVKETPSWGAKEPSKVYLYHLPQRGHLYFLNHHYQTQKLKALVSFLHITFGQTTTSHIDAGADHAEGLQGMEMCGYRSRTKAIMNMSEQSEIIHRLDHNI